MGTLYYGDNLDILRRYLKDETVDLVYLDPPFKSDQNYNVLFQEKNGTAAAAQIQAFEDTWHWNVDAEKTYAELITQPGKVSEVMQAFMTFLGRNDMMAYLTMMASRLVELRRVLKPTGSLYLHCDPTASHYLKLLLDAIFGKENFLNEIIWKRTSAHGSARRWGPIHDAILFVSKSDHFTWNRTFQNYDADYIEGFYKQEDEQGRYQLVDLTGAGKRSGDSGEPWKGINPTEKGRHWAVPNFVLEKLSYKRKIARMTSQEKLDVLEKHGMIQWPAAGGVPRYKRYLSESEGVPIQDVITDVRPISSHAKERLGYPTQKPVTLLERILKASSNPGDAVLDPFCGCGTTIEAAEKLGREWIGIDVTQLAITLIKKRLRDHFGKKVAFKVIGEPVTPAEAAKLADEDKFQFQCWALGLVNARPEEPKKGADKGIDGKILFRDDPKATKPEQIILQVKGGKTGVKDVRDLRGVLDREKAAIGVLISLQPPTREMETEAASAGFYEHKITKRKYPRLQLRTVKELMEGKDLERPSDVAAIDETFKRAPESMKPHGEQWELRELGV
jgi:site-specific DNA-methyltransferase (adenine-specific)